MQRSNQRWVQFLKRGRTGRRYAQWLTYVGEQIRNPDTSTPDQRTASGKIPTATPTPECSGALPSLQGKRVIIVEDEGTTVLQLRKAMTRAGMLVVGTANNGRQAIEVVLRENPDLVTMDIRMPILDGLEAARRIMETRPTCIVMLTAFSEEDYEAQASRVVGAAGYITKPVDSSTLLPQIQRAYQQYSQA